MDDLLITCVNESSIMKFVNDLRSIYKEVKHESGPNINYLGMTMNFATAGSVRIGMSNLINEYIRDYGVTGSAACPANSNLFIISENSTLLDDDDKKLFHTKAAKLLYMAKRARPDLDPLAAFLVTRVQSPTEEDLKKLLHGEKYLNQTITLEYVINPIDLQVGASVDASFATHPDAKGHTGVIVTIGGATVWCGSTKQKLVCRSSAEAELVGLSDSIPKIIYCRNFMVSQGHHQDPSVVKQDNKSTIVLAEKGRSTSDRSRHIHIRYFYVKDNILRGDIKLMYQESQDIVADILTKPLQGELFRKLRGRLLGSIK